MRKRLDLRLKPNVVLKRGPRRRIREAGTLNYRVSRVAPTAPPHGGNVIQGKQIAQLWRRQVFSHFSSPFATFFLQHQDFFAARRA